MTLEAAMAAIALAVYLSATKPQPRARRIGTAIFTAAVAVIMLTGQQPPRKFGPARP
jgi:hypothetical protein